MLVTFLSGGASVTNNSRVPVRVGAGFVVGVVDGSSDGSSADGSVGGDGVRDGVVAGCAHAPATRANIPRIAVTRYNFVLSILILSLVNLHLYYITKKV